MAGLGLHTGYVGDGAYAALAGPTGTLTGSHEIINDAAGVLGPAGGRITDLPFAETYLTNQRGARAR